MASKFRELAKLSPSEFENLVFDLAIGRGMVNVVWRTPGADGGRDIEAESVHIDLAGSQTFAKWYIECKRYQGSVDWPTIHPKLAYADAAGADYLLLCTTAKFTPQAVNNVTSWNGGRRFPQIRLWPIHELGNQLRQHPDLCRKYGLRTETEAPGASLVALSLALSKTVGSAYSSLVIQDKAPSRMLGAAHSLALLLQYRLEEIEEHGRFSIQPPPAPWHPELDAELTGTPEGVDEPSLVAFVSYLSALTGQRLKVIFTGPRTYSVACATNIEELLTRYREAFAAIALWGNFEFSFEKTIAIVRQRP